MIGAFIDYVTNLVIFAAADRPIRTSKNKCSPPYPPPTPSIFQLLLLLSTRTLSPLDEFTDPRDHIYYISILRILF